MAANPKITFDFKRSILNPKHLSFLNTVNFTSHFKIEHDPYGYKTALEKFETDEKTRITNDEKKRLGFLKDISDIQAEIQTASTEERAHLEKKLVHLREHEAQLTHSKPSKRPEKYSEKFFTIDGDLENKFDNDDSTKFKYGSNKVFEANFVMKHLYDKNYFLSGEASGI